MSKTSSSKILRPLKNDPVILPIPFEFAGLRLGLNRRRSDFHSRRMLDQHSLVIGTPNFDSDF